MGGSFGASGVSGGINIGFLAITSGAFAGSFTAASSFSKAALKALVLVDGIRSFVSLFEGSSSAARTFLVPLGSGMREGSFTLALFNAFNALSLGVSKGDVAGSRATTRTGSGLGSRTSVR